MQAPVRIRHVRDPLLFMPESWMSAEVCENLPGIKSAFDELRRALDVSVFRWPCTTGASPAKSGWRGVAAAMAREIDSMAAAHGKPVTLLAMPDASPIAIAAIRGHEKSVAGFVSVSIHFSNGTLRALGMHAMVDFLNAQARTAEAAEQGSHARRFLRFAMDDATEEELSQAAIHVDATVDWACWDAFFASYHEKFDLTSLAPLPVVPTLYLDPPSKVYAGGEKLVTFTHMFPHAEVKELKVWPARLQDGSTGRELSEKVIPFWRRNAKARRR
jgi:hypothetical protein